MSTGLKKWFQEDWVDIGAPKKGGGFKKCGRKSAKSSKRKYPKCVPAAKQKQQVCQKLKLDQPFQGNALKNKE